MVALLQLIERFRPRRAATGSKVVRPPYAVGSGPVTTTAAYTRHVDERHPDIERSGPKVLTRDPSTFAGTRGHQPCRPRRSSRERHPCPGSESEIRSSRADSGKRTPTGGTPRCHRGKPSASDRRDLSGHRELLLDHPCRSCRTRRRMLFRGLSKTGPNWRTGRTRSPSRNQPGRCRRRTFGSKFSCVRVTVAMFLQVADAWSAGQLGPDDPCVLSDQRTRRAQLPPEWETKRRRGRTFSSSEAPGLAK